MKQCAIGSHAEATLAENLPRRCKGRGGPSWYIDETYIRARGRWRYLYRAIDRDGALVDVMLSEHRDLAAARAFFRSAKAVTGITPDRVTTDAMMHIPERPSSASMCGIGRVGISTTDLSRTIAASSIDVDPWLAKRVLCQRHATAAAMTNCETFYDVDPVCVNMFPPECAAGGICGRLRPSSLSWQQLECSRRWPKLAQLKGASRGLAKIPQNGQPQTSR
jgi:hypothetical protein